MRSTIFEAIGTVGVQDLPEPTLLSPTDAIVRVAATTICGSDLHIIGGHMVPEIGFPIGHEWVGEVIEVGSAVTRFRPGQRVSSPPAPWCGTCDTCRRGQTQRCERGGVLGSGPSMGDLGGAQSTGLRVPWADHVLALIPDEVSDRDALAVADVLCTGWSGVVHADVEAGNTVVVLGCGPVGLSAVHTARQLTAARRVIAVDPVPLRRERALELGADLTLSPEDDVAAVIAELTGGWGAESVIDAAGVQSTFDLATAVVAVGGKISILGIPARPHEVNVVGLLMKNVTLWTGLGELHHMDRLLRLVADGVLDPGPLFTHEATLEELPEYYRRLAAGDLDIIKIFATTGA